MPGNYSQDDVNVARKIQDLVRSGRDSDVTDDEVDWAIEVLGSVSQAPAQDDVFADPETAPAVGSKSRSAPVAAEPAAQPETELDLQVANWLDKSGIGSVGAAVTEGMQRGAFMNVPRMLDMVGSDVVDVARALGEGKSLGDIWYGRNGFRRSFVDRNPDQFQRAAEEHPVVTGVAQVASSPFVAGRAFNALEKAAGAGVGSGALESAVRGGVANAAGGAMSRTIDQAVQPELRDMTPEQKLRDLALATLGSGALGGMANYAQSIAGRTPNLGARSTFRQETEAGQALQSQEALDMAEVGPSTILTNKPVAGKTLQQAVKEHQTAMAQLSGTGKVIVAAPEKLFEDKATAAMMDVVESLQAKAAQFEAAALPKLQGLRSSAESTVNQLDAMRGETMAAVTAAAKQRAQQLQQAFQAQIAQKNYAGAQMVFEQLKKEFPEETMQAIATRVDDMYAASDVASEKAARALLTRVGEISDSVVESVGKSRTAVSEGFAGEAIAQAEKAAASAGVLGDAAEQVSAARGIADKAVEGRAPWFAPDDFMAEINTVRLDHMLGEKPMPGAENVLRAIDKIEEGIKSLPAVREGMPEAAEGAANRMTLGEALKLVNQVAAVSKEASATYSPATAGVEAISAKLRSSVYEQSPLAKHLRKMHSMALSNLANMLMASGLKSGTNKFDTNSLEQLTALRDAIVKNYGKPGKALETQAIDAILNSGLSPNSQSAQATRQAIAELSGIQQGLEALGAAGIKRPASGIGGGWNVEPLAQAMKQGQLAPGSELGRATSMLAEDAGIQGRVAKYGELARSISKVTSDLGDEDAIRAALAQYGKDPVRDARLDKIASLVPGLRQNLDETAALAQKAAATEELPQRASRLASFRLGRQRQVASKDVSALKEAGVSESVAGTEQSMRSAMVNRGASSDAMVNAMRKAGLSDEAIAEYGKDMADLFVAGGTNAALQRIAASKQPVLDSVRGILKQAAAQGEQSPRVEAEVMRLIRSSPELHKQFKLMKAMEFLQATYKPATQGSGITATSAGNMVIRGSRIGDYRLEAARKLVGESESSVLVSTMRQLYDIYRRNTESEQ